MNTPSNTKKIKNCKLLKCRYEERHPNKIEDLQELEAYEMKDAVLVYDSHNSCAWRTCPLGASFWIFPFIMHLITSVNLSPYPEPTQMTMGSMNLWTVMVRRALWTVIASMTL